MGASSRRKGGIKEQLMLLLEYSPAGLYSPRERILSLLLCRVPYALAGWIYFALFTIQTIVSWILRDYGGYSGCQSSITESDEDQALCGPLAVLRISMGSFLFFGLMVLVTIGVKVEDEDDWRTVTHRGLWPYKIIIWGVLVGTTFLYPDAIFENVYQHIAQALGVMFLVISMIIVLDCIYAINEFVLEKDSFAYSAFLVISTVLLIGISLGGCVLLYMFWVPSASCGLNIAFITSNIGLFLIYALLSMSSIRPENTGLFGSALTFAFTTFYTWNALNSEPDSGMTEGCTPDGNPGGKALRIVAFIIAMATISLSALNSAKSWSSFSLDYGSSEKGVLYRQDFFYFVYFTASGYMAMVLLGWDTVQTDQENDDFVLDKGMGSTWAKMSAAWFCALLYTSSLVSHKILGRWREF